MNCETKSYSQNIDKKYELFFALLYVLLFTTFLFSLPFILLTHMKIDSTVVIKSLLCLKNLLSLYKSAIFFKIQDCYLVNDTCQEKLMFF